MTRRGPLTVVGSLEFSRDGNRLVVRGEGGLSILDLRGQLPPVVIAGHVDAFAAIADQIWVVAGSTLSAYDLAGAALGSVPVADPGPSPRLLRSPAARLAAWMGNEVATVAFDRRLVATPLATEVELALPLSSTRTLVANRQRLALRDQDSARWTISLAQLGTVTDAAIVLDGKAVAITTSSAAGQAIAVIGLRDGALLHRIVVGEVDSISYAAARGVALVLTRDSRLVLIDLRFGRVIVNYTEQRAVVDATIDDAGREIALRLADGEVVQISVMHLLAATAATPAAIEAAIEPIAPVAEPAAARPRTRA